MTDQEAQLLALARSEALKTTVSWDRFLATIAKTRKVPKDAHWTKAGAALEQLKHQPAPKPASPDLSAVRNLLVFATVTDDAVRYACRLGPSWKTLFTADPAYPVLDSHINALRASGHGVFAWGDCHSLGLMPANIVQFMLERGLDGWYGEAESAAAFDRAISGSMVRLAESTEFHVYRPIGLIANLSALSPSQIIRIASGQVLATAELYRNVQPNMLPDWRNANQGVGGNCVAVYESSSEGAVYTPISKYIADGLWNPKTDSVFCEGLLESDWKALGA